MCGTTRETSCRSVCCARFLRFFLGLSLLIAACEAAFLCVLAFWHIKNAILCIACQRPCCLFTTTLLKWLGCVHYFSLSK
jgi:hypothetical protein